MQLPLCFTDVYKERTGKEFRGTDGETHVNKVKSIGGAAYAHFRGNSAARARATLPHSGSAWRLRYAHRERAGSCTSG